MRTITLFSLAVLCMAFITNAAAFVPVGPSVMSKKDSSLQMTILTYGNKKKNFKPGTPLKKAVAQLGIKPKYSCNKGDCATCQVLIAGQFAKPCVGKVPPEPKLKSLQQNGLPISL